MSLPRGWTLAAIADFTVAKVEQRAPGRHVRYVDISAIDRARKVVGAVEEVDAKTAPTRARQWIRSGDVLVSMTRPNLNAVAMITADLEGAVASTGFDVLRALGVLPGWLFARVRSREFVNDICDDVQGVVYPAVRPDDIRGHRMPIPPGREQRRIVDALDSYMSRLDAAEKSLEEAQAKLKAYRASVLKAAVEGRLVPTEAELARREKRSYEPAQVLLDRILKERRRRWEAAELARLKKAGKAPKDDKWKAKYKEPVEPKTSGLPPLSDGWCWASVDQLLTERLSNGRSVPSGSGHPVLRLTAIRDGGVELTEQKRGSWGSIDPAEFVVERDDFLIVRGNGSLHLVGRGGRVGEVRDAVAFPDTLIRARIAGVTPDLFTFLWDSEPVRRHIEKRAKSTAGIYKVNQADLEHTPIAVAPEREQGRLIDEIERLLSVSTSANASVEREVARIGLLRQAILKWAFEGRLVDQDPNDEPAEELLARVRAERATAPKPGRTGRRRHPSQGAVG